MRRRKRIRRPNRRPPYLRQAIAEALEERQMLTLTIDVRAADGSKSIQLGNIGQVVNLQVWAEITDPLNQPTEDGLQDLAGSFLGTNVGPGPVAGNLAATLVSPFNYLASQNGTVQDLNGDGNLDVGSNDNSTVTNFFFARSQFLQTSNSGTIVGNALEFEIGTLTYTVTHLNYGGETDINFRPRGSTEGLSVAVWREDNQGVNDTNSTFAAGAPFVVTAPPAKLAFTAEPNSTTAGSDIDSPSGVQVSLEDAAGNLLTSSDNITIALSANPGGGSLSGTLIQPAVNGIATFPDLFLTKAATGYSFSAVDSTVAGVAAVTSTTFNITPTTASQLVFINQPVSSTVGLILNAPTGVKVALQDAFGNDITTGDDEILLSLSQNPTADIGSVGAMASNGIATFTNLKFISAGVGYTLTAIDDNNAAVPAAISQLFNINTAPGFTTLQSFTYGPVGYNPYGSLAMDSNGNLYGTTTAGGLYGYGTVFELSGANYSTYTTLVSFTGQYGSYPGSTPEGGLIFDSNGNLYGTTYTGGFASDGTVFELSGPNHTTFNSLHAFVGSIYGQNPTPTLTIDSNGNLFGTTSEGGGGSGAFGNGTVFEISAGTQTFKVLTGFTGTSGASPGISPGPLTIDGNGNLYGATYSGGSSSDGTVFELAAPNYTMFTSLISFTGTSGSFPGANPFGGLIFDGNGNLLGTTRYGGTPNDGTVFQLSGASHTAFASLISFTGNSGSFPGANPQGTTLVLDTHGNLYGTTRFGGANGEGTIFELSGSNYATFASLVSFTDNSAGQPGTNNPVEGLILDTNGNLYGTDDFGGAYGTGSVFTIAGPSHTSLTTLFSFGPTGGITPVASLVMDSSGNLYGTTQAGGLYNDGTVFELSGTNYSTYTTLVSFTGTSGSDPGYSPQAALTLDANGNLFGATIEGGPANDGTVFELSGTSHTFTSLFSFTGNSGNFVGRAPSGLTLDPVDGNLYGMTIQGGNAGQTGTVFELSGPNYSTFASLASFNPIVGDSYGSGAPLVVDSSGNLYGTTDGPGNGAAFEMSGPTHATFTTLYVFSGGDGGQPSGLAIDGSGNLYGATANTNTIYELSGATHTTFTSLVTFTGNSGNYPGSGPSALIVDSSGNLFGTTSGGGNFSNGTVFELSGPTHTTYTNLAFFTGTSGSEPGATPKAALFLNPTTGALYGTTSAGGTYGLGSLFEIIPATQLAFAGQVSSAYAGSTLPTITVNVQDVQGNTDPIDSSQVTLSISNGPAGATLGGTTTVTAINGVASFTNLSFSIPGNYTLIATDAALSPATSNPFTIQPPTVAWTGAAGGLNWNNPGNWSDDQVPTANTDVTIPSGFSVLLGSGTFSVDSLTASSPIEIANAATLLLSGPSTFASTLTIDNGGTLKVAADPVVLVLNGSAFTDNGTIDLGANDMIIHNGNLSQLRQGLISSAATSATTLAIELNNDGNGNPLMTTFDNQHVTNTDVLVKFTYFGDTNLDGSVTAQDYLAIDNAFSFNSTNPTTPLTGWNNGDFNYDGVINGDDYTLIDNAYNSQSTVPLVSQAQAIISQTIAPKIVTAPTTIAQTDITAPIWPFDFNPLDKRKPSLANEIFTD